MENTKQDITRIAKQVSRFVLRYKGNDLMDRVNSILNLELSAYGSQSLASTLVLNEVSQEARDLIYMPVGMTQEGNYTTDSSKWA